MKKEDLVVGKHIVQLANGKIGVLMYDEYDRITVISTTANLTNPTFNEDEEYDIIKIGIPTFSADIGLFEQPQWIWEKDKEPKEMTLGEVVDELGYNIKIIK